MTVRTDDRRAQKRLAFVLTAPAVVLMLAVTAYPVAYAIWLSLQRYNLASPADTKFVGWQTTRQFSPTSTGGQRFS